MGTVGAIGGAVAAAPAASTGAVTPAASSGGAHNHSKFAMHVHGVQGHHGHKFMMSLREFLAILEAMMLGNAVNPKQASQSYNNAGALSTSSGSGSSTSTTA